MGAKLFVYRLWKVLPYSWPVPGPVSEVTHHLKIACNRNITCSEFIITLVQFSDSGTVCAYLQVEVSHIVMVFLFCDMVTCTVCAYLQVEVSHIVMVFLFCDVATCRVCNL